MYYIESGVPRRDMEKLTPYTKQFRRRLKRKWSMVVLPNILSGMDREKVPKSWDTERDECWSPTSDDEIKYRNCKSICSAIYGHKEHKWVSKHTFMLLSPLIQRGIKTEDGRIIRLPSSMLRIIFVCLYGHGP